MNWQSGGGSCKRHRWKTLKTYSLSPQTDLITGVVELVGRDVALDLFQQTRKIEGGGGMMIKNGSRRRTPGGLYLQLLRDRAKEDHRIDEIKVQLEPLLE